LPVLETPVWSSTRAHQRWWNFRRGPVPIWFTRSLLAATRLPRARLSSAVSHPNRTHHFTPDCLSRHYGPPHAVYERPRLSAAPRQLRCCHSLRQRSPPSGRQRRIPPASFPSIPTHVEFDISLRTADMGAVLRRWYCRLCADRLAHVRRLRAVFFLSLATAGPAPLRGLWEARGPFRSRQNILVVFICRGILVRLPSAPALGQMCITTSRCHLVFYSLFGIRID
jgi:hypothetical protein